MPAEMDKMWYNFLTLSDNNGTHTCFQCGSPLIEIKKEDQASSNPLYPQTVTTYRCSNQECQEEKDRMLAKRLKLKEERKVVEQKRAEARLTRKSTVGQNQQ